MVIEKSVLEHRSIAVVGAGIAGLTCASALSKAGHDVVIIDKGRVPGGRISTRQAYGFSFDHGAQYATATTPEFSACMSRTEQAGMAARWQGAIAIDTDRLANADNAQNAAKPRWVGVPGMRSLAEYLAADMTVASSVRIGTLIRGDDGWRLITDDGRDYASADTVVIAVPAPQAVELLAACDMLAQAAAGVVMDPCWTVMAVFDRRLDLPFDAAFFDHGPLSWIARNSSKPERGDVDTWVLHASPDCSRSFLEADGNTIISELRRAFEGVGAPSGLTPLYETAHRWRYARVAKPVGTACLYDAERRIGACGDWLLGAKIEAAFLSGRALAERIIAEHREAASGRQKITAR